MASNIARIKLTGGNLRSGHFYITSCKSLFPSDAIGGSNGSNPGNPVTVTFKPGNEITTDIPNDKNFFRERAPTREFFELTNAEVGDTVVLERVGKRSYVVSLEKTANPIAANADVRDAKPLLPAVGTIDAPVGKSNAWDEIADASADLDQLGATERKAVINARLGQGQFRDDLISYWGGCAVTGVTCLEMLRASHIKPWCDGDNRERLDKFNGLLLTPNLDQAFDRALITFDTSGAIIISPAFGDKLARSLGITPDLRLKKLEPAHHTYLAWHAEIFSRRHKQGQR